MIRPRGPYDDPVWRENKLAQKDVLDFVADLDKAFEGIQMTAISKVRRKCFQEQQRRARRSGWVILVWVILSVGFWPAGFFVGWVVLVLACIIDQNL